MIHTDMNHTGNKPDAFIRAYLGYLMMVPNKQNLAILCAAWKGGLEKVIIQILSTYRVRKFFWEGPNCKQVVFTLKLALTVCIMKSLSHPYINNTIHT